MKSSNGYFLCLAGPRSSAPLSFGHKKQGCTSLSTPEAETVSLAFGMKNVGIPSLSIWETVFGRSVQLRALEDNEACISIALAGYSPTMRHLDRTQRTYVGFLGDVFANAIAVIEYVESEKQAADLFTKDIKPKDWLRVCSLTGLEFHHSRDKPG